MFRGETFFDAAIRKTADETGSDKSLVTPKAVIKTWNTFFPDSNWDKERRPGFEGTQTVNTIVLCEFEGDEIEQKSESKEQWAVSDHRWVSPDEILVKGAYDKYVQLNVAIAKRRGLLH